MSLDRAARKAFGVTLETLTRRILATFDRATVADLEAGARWYDEAGDLAIELSHLMPDRSVERAAALISALSPRTQWSRNVTGAVQLANGLDAPGQIGTNLDRAQRVLDARTSTDALAVLTGPKIAAFARNIAGSRESVTVDVWAARAAGVDETKLRRRGAYDAVAHAYRAAARRRGVDPATMQATTWIVARNGRSS